MAPLPTGDCIVPGRRGKLGGHPSLRSLVAKTPVPKPIATPYPTILVVLHLVACSTSSYATCQDPSLPIFRAPPHLLPCAAHRAAGIASCHHCTGSGQGTRGQLAISSCRWRVASMSRDVSVMLPRRTPGSGPTRLLGSGGSSSIWRSATKSRDAAQGSTGRCSR